MAVFALTPAVTTLMWHAGVSAGKEIIALDPKTVLAQINLSAAKEKKFQERIAERLVPVQLFASPGVAVQTADVEGEVAEVKTLSGLALGYALRFTCVTNAINALVVSGPLTAKRFAFSVGSISWQAGEGLPVYTTYCPVNAYGSRDLYRHAKSHQVVPSIRGQNYFIGCSSSGVCESAGVGQIMFAVNDWIYTDNRGTFEVVIYSVS